MADNGFTIKHRDDFEQEGMWLYARKALGVNAFGMNLVRIPKGNSIPEHDETERDQEEVFAILEGDAVFVVNGEDHPAPAGSFIRLDPEPSRTVRNDGDAEVLLLIVSAPRSSGYEPMPWG